MNPYLLSFLLYAVPANIIAGMILLFGRRRQVRWLAVEYPFIYLPWLAFLVLVTLVFGGIESTPNNPKFMQAIVVLQSFGSGIMGGAVLFPRLLIPAGCRRRILTVTFASACVVSFLYVQFRVILFIVLETLGTGQSVTAA